MRKFIFIGLLVGAALAQSSPAASQKKSVPAKTATAKPTVAHTATVSEAGQTEATVTAFMQRMFGYDPEVKWKIADISPTEAAGVTRVVVYIGDQQQRPTYLYVLPGGEFALTGEMIPYGSDPFGKTRDKLNRQAKGQSRGSQNPSVTLVEFSDLQCPHCRLTQPIIDKLLADVPNAKLIFQPYPLTQLHPWAETAAKYAECVADQDKPAFWKFVQAVYDAQNDIKLETADQQLSDIATNAGVEAGKLPACVKSPNTYLKVQNSLALGQGLEVTGTPTLFINGRKIVGITDMPYGKLKAMVEFEARAAAKK
jgi:protein-disulfide isomerase